MAVEHAVIDGERDIRHRPITIASLPSTSRTTTRFSSLPTPRIADCGWLMMIGVATSEPETP